ncbi:GMC oxidoreductase [Piscinibacter sp. XHJ-5]|uniref:GMC family oxidoreductase N-terminal domain-containing protein n=1 Tax=Piscinibacter sp. XHJ-5 TaxID=3037797 RepID=UPI0024531279|nr:GMC oxidoreductase [Piscinibacter sp. XHJ-5]
MSNSNRRLSRPLDEMKAHYTVVVVGSGYGAGVAASRLARAGQSVCVLERGREIRPGEYPADLSGAQAEMQVDTARGRLGNPVGLFNLHLNDDMLAMVGCGLGGTSLINANVALQIDKRMFRQQHWPAEFRNDPDLLDGFCEQAMRMLDARAYPADFPPLNKLEALQQSAVAMKQPFYRPPIAVNFEDQVNAFGVGQKKCTLCGDCTSGCNHAAKNTTLMNYLPDACNHGAEIYTRARVTHVERDDERWRVHIEHDGSDGSAAASVVGADIVVLGAGSLGSTEILLRSKARGLPLSDRLGQRFSGNGDVLAFSYDSCWRSDAGTWRNVNGVGVGTNDVPAADLPGPCITGVIDMRGAADVTQGLVIEEGVIPGALAAAMPPALFFANAQAGDFFSYGAAQAKSRLLDAQATGEALQNSPGSMAAMSYSGPVGRTQTYLVMSVDDAGGALELRDDRLRIVWPDAGASPVIARDNALLAKAAEAIQGQFIANPLWSEPLGRKLVTVHPVGGCGMGDSAEAGVVNHRCQVFASVQGREVHRGLYVCDGAVMPGPVGVNPLLTISAVAERACRLIADEHGWTIADAMAPAQPLPPGFAVAAAVPVADDEGLAGDLAGLGRSLLKHLEDGAIDIAKDILSAIIEKHPDALAPTFQFTEGMHGHVSLRAVEDTAPPGERISSPYELAAAWGRAEGTALRFDLTIATDDLDRLVSDPAHPAQITGTVTCAALSASPMKVAGGVFHLLPVDAQRVETWTMTYEMQLEREGAGPLHFSGFKVLHQQDGSHWWNDVTTLYVTLRDGDASGAPVARGILTLGLEDLLWQGASIRVGAGKGALAELLAHVPRAQQAVQEVYLAKFAGFFGMVLFRAYGGMLADLKDFPAQDDAARPRRALRAPAPEVVDVPLPDGFHIRLTRYRGGARGPVVLAPGFSIRASSYAIDTVDENLVEFLTAAEYDVWLLAYRASPDSGSPLAPYTIDDIARIDWPAAVHTVLQHTGAGSVQVIAHCISSMSLLMSLLDGLQGVRSVISSQLTLHPVTDWINDLKADMGLVALLDRMSPLKGVFPLVPGTSELDAEIDVATWKVPVPDGEQCKNPVCHRVFSIYGPSYAHARLNHWTHTAMREMFGPVSIKPFEQLALIMRKGHVVDSAGNDTYLQPDKARNLALPISFLAGSANQLFYPETAARTLAWLRARNDPGLYQLRLLPGYAHFDVFVGRDAARDVYPYLREQLDRFN